LSELRPVRSTAEIWTNTLTQTGRRGETSGQCQLILGAKWAAATPVAALSLAGQQQALTGNNNDLTFAIRL
jgi:hypothetical protein